MKKTQNSIRKEGRTGHWCPHHKVEGSYNGLYVTHKPGEHDEWDNNKAQFRRKKSEVSKRKDLNDDNKEDTSEKKFTMTDNLKLALLTSSDLTGV